MKATLRPGAVRARIARPYRGIVDGVPILWCFGLTANPLPVAMADGWQTEGVTDSYARSAS